MKVARTEKSKRLTHWSLCVMMVIVYVMIGKTYLCLQSKQSVFCFGVIAKQTCKLLSFSCKYIASFEDFSMTIVACWLRKANASHPLRSDFSTTLMNYVLYRRLEKIKVANDSVLNILRQRYKTNPFFKGFHSKIRSSRIRCPFATPRIWVSIIYRRLSRTKVD